MFLFDILEFIQRVPRDPLANKIKLPSCRLPVTGLLQLLNRNRTIRWQRTYITTIKNINEKILNYRGLYAKNAVFGFLSDFNKNITKIKITVTQNPSYVNPTRTIRVLGHLLCRFLKSIQIKVVYSHKHKG